MADERSIVITLKVDKAQENEANTSNQTSSSSSVQSNDKDSTGKALASWAAVQLANTTVQEVTAWGEYFWNRELMLTDDYIAQRNKQIVSTHVNRVIGAASTIGSSAAQGAMIGGWVGAILGAAIGTLNVGLNIVRSNVEGQKQQDLQLKQLDAQLQFTRSRAGWSTHAASIGEDL